MINNSLTKLIIADDHNIIIDGLEQILTREEGYEILAKINNGKMLMQALNSLSPDMVLLDIQMPLMDGLEAASLIKKKMPHIKIVIMSMIYEKSVKKFIEEHEIDGFIIKQAGAPELKKALKSILAGDKTFLIPQEMTGLAENAVKSSGNDILNLYKLTRTEIDIIRLIAGSNSSKMIADIKGIETSTVVVHRRNIFRKLGANNMADIVAFAIKHGLG